MAVARLGSFKHAAAELLRTQPSITLAIQQLEHSIGLKLLERTTRKVIPTLEGENFIPIAERLLRDFDSAISNLTATSERRSGHVNVVMLPSIATRILPDLMRSFIDAYPGITVEAADDNSRAIQNRLLRNEVDFGIGGDQRRHADLSYVPLIEDRMELLCHKDHALAKKTGPVEWDEVKNYRFLDSGLPEIVAHENLERDPRYRFTTVLSLLSMLEANIGVTILPTFSIPNGNDQIVSRPLAEPILTRKIYLITRKEWTLSPASSALIEILMTVVPQTVKAIGNKHIKSILVT